VLSVRAAAAMDLGDLGALSGAGGKSAKDNELAKAMFEGTQQYRKKLKLPEMTPAAEKIKETVHGGRGTNRAAVQRAVFVY
jgi:hypothetical protein